MAVLIKSIAGPQDGKDQTFAGAFSEEEPLSVSIHDHDAGTVQRLGKGVDSAQSDQSVWSAQSEVDPGPIILSPTGSLTGVDQYGSPEATSFRLKLGGLVSPLPNDHLTGKFYKGNMISDTAQKKSN